MSFTTLITIQPRLAGVVLLLLTITHVEGWVSTVTTTRSSSYCTLTRLRMLPNPMDEEDDGNYPVSRASENRRNFLIQLAATTAAVVPITSSLAEDKQPKKTSNEECVDEKVVKDLMESQEKDLIQDIKREEKKESKAVKDTDKLIKDLEKTAEKKVSPPPPAPPSPSSSSPPPAPKTDKTPTLTAQKSDLERTQKLIDAETQEMIDQLEAEEEVIEEETMQLMRKVETLEAAAERLNKPLLPEPDAKTPEEAVSKSQKETYEFLDKLKKRYKEKEEFIKLLKEESKAYASGSADKKLPELLSSLRKTAESDKEFNKSLNNFRERLQTRFSGK